MSHELQAELFQKDIFVKIKRFLKIFGTVFLALFLFLIIISIVVYHLQDARKGVPFVLDQVNIWDEKMWNNDKYILAQIITGFHEKAEEAAIFRGQISYKWKQPVYDNVIFREHIDQKFTNDYRLAPTRYPTKGYLELEMGRVRVVFDNGEQQIFDISKVGSFQGRLYPGKKAYRVDSY